MLKNYLYHYPKPHMCLEGILSKKKSAEETVTTTLKEKVYIFQICLYENLSPRDFWIIVKNVQTFEKMADFTFFDLWPENKEFFKNIWSEELRKVGDVINQLLWTFVQNCALQAKNMVFSWNNRVFLKMATGHKFHNIDLGKWFS